MVPLPFKDQQSANSVKKQIQILSANIVVQINPVNPQLFLSGYGYRPHVSGEFASESGKK